MPRNLKYKTDNNSGLNAVQEKTNKDYENKKMRDKTDLSLCMNHYRLLLHNLHSSAKIYFKEVLDKESILNSINAQSAPYDDRPMELLNKLAKELDNSNENYNKMGIYRKFRQVSAEKNYVFENWINSKRTNIEEIYLSSYIQPYLLSIIYPYIFEDYDSIQHGKEIEIFKKYSYFIYNSFRMLEAAIIADGFFMAIDDCCLQLLNNDKPTNFSDGIKTIRDKISKCDGKTKNYTYNLAAIYINFLEYSKLIYHGNNDDSDNNKDSSSKKHNILIYDIRFFLSNKKGEIRFNNMACNIGELKHYCDEVLNNDDFSYQEKILFLYVLSRRTHIFDFNYHEHFPTVDFHITGGFITNLVLYHLIKNFDIIADKYTPYNLREDELDKIQKTYYACNLSDFYLKNTITLTDLAFIRNLIKKVAISFKLYDLNIQTAQSKNTHLALRQNNNLNLWEAVLKYIEIPDNDSKSNTDFKGLDRKYYIKIYNDLYSYYELFKN